MELSKRSLTIICVGWLVAVLLASLVAGYYFTEFQKEAQLSQDYADTYNGLVQNYTDLLDEYLDLAQQYELEKQNLTELLERYGRAMMHVRICIDYKEWNGTTGWHNDTIVPMGCNLLQATEVVAVINSTYWPSLQRYFVDAINGVWNGGARFWMWLSWNDAQERWEYGNVGADGHKLANNEIVMWRYEIPP